MGKPPYEQRTDIERLHLQWTNLTGLHNRNEASSAIVRCATAAEVAANFAIRAKFLRRSQFDARIVDGFFIWATGFGKAALRKAVLKAVRVVRASFARTSERTRATAAAKPANIAAAVERVSVGEGLNRSVGFDLLPHPEAAAAMRQVEDRMEIDFILGQAPSLVARSLRLIHLDDEPVELVASATHLGRFTLNRQVKAFRSTWRLAA